MSISYDTTLYPTPRLAIEEVVDRSGTFVEQVVGGHVTRENVDEYVEQIWPDMVDAYGGDAGDAELTEDDLREYLVTIIEEDGLSNDRSSSVDQPAR